MSLIISEKTYVRFGGFPQHRAPRDVSHSTTNLQLAKWSGHAYVRHRSLTPWLRSLAMLDLNQTTLESLEVGAVPILTTFLQQLELRELFDRHFPPPALLPGRSPDVPQAT